jgi:NAD(P)H-dependent flavin oxidoreductase YrpB (nitropropane dioxygenase family)
LPEALVLARLVRLTGVQDRLTKLLGCELPIQLAPMGSVSVRPDLALALADAGGHARLAGAELPVPRFGPQAPTRTSTGAIAAMPFYAGQSAGVVHRVQPAAEIVTELARALHTSS